MVYLEHLIEYQILNNFQCLVLYFGGNALFDFKLNEFFGFYSLKIYGFWGSVLWVRWRREEKNAPGGHPRATGDTVGTSLEFLSHLAIRGH